MSRLYHHDKVTRAGVALFSAAGANFDQATATVRSLVTSSLMGHDSHGAMRIPEYLGFVEDGSIVKDAKLTIEHTGPTTAIVDCGQGFGAVGAERAIREGVAIAREQRTACVITRRCNHVGRLGAWVQIAADEGMIALATCNSPIYGHFVLPWGGREGRLATNPIAYAVPTGGDPVVSDFSTSVAPEGKIRFYRNEGKHVPDGWILDYYGQPTNDPSDFYGNTQDATPENESNETISRSVAPSPKRGGILPLGGSAGRKGFAMSLLVEILGSALAGVSSEDTEVFGNGVCFIVIDPSSFCPLETFRKVMDDMVRYMKSSSPAPGFDEVLVPGELEFRTLRQREVEGIPIDEPTHAVMCEQGGRLRVDVDKLLA